MRLSLAGPQDVGDIVGLLQANEAINGGSLTGHFDRPAVMAAIRDMPVVIARTQQRLETAVRPSPPEKTCNGIVFVGQFLIDEG